MSKIENLFTVEKIDTDIYTISEYKHCKENRIEGVMSINFVWLILISAEKTFDTRRKIERGGIGE